MTGSVTTAEPDKIICNEDWYLDTAPDCIRGGILELDKDTPIGYNVHLPKGGVQAIFTVVYGGYQKSDKALKVMKPGVLSPLEKYLLAHNVAVVTLNLIDFKYLDVPQQQIPLDVHELLHKGINKYWEIFNQQPESLHPDLLVLKNKKNFLFGQSFGGRTSVRQAQKFPKTFAGYISADGALAYEISAKNKPAINESFFGIPETATEEQRKAWHYSDPSKYIDDLQDNVLIIHNYDDNRVSISVSLYWYDLAIKSGKENLVSLLILERGNPIPGEGGEAYKGHFLPTEKKQLALLSETVLNFIRKGHSSLPALGNIASQSFGTFAHKHLLGSTVQERFLSAAYRYYINDQRERGFQEISEEAWREIYLPLFYAVNLASKPGVIPKNKIDIKNIDDDAIKSALSIHAENFIEYLKEQKLINADLSNKTLKELFLNQPGVRIEFKRFIEEALMGSDYSAASVQTRNRYVLWSLFIAKPSLLINLFEEFEKDDTIKREAEAARLAFNNLLKERAQKIQKLWQQAAQQGRILDRLVALKFMNMMQRLMAKPPSDYLVTDYEQLVGWSNMLAKFWGKERIIEDFRKLTEFFSTCTADVACAQHYASARIILSLLSERAHEGRVTFREIITLLKQTGMKDLFNEVYEDRIYRFGSQLDHYLTYYQGGSAEVKNMIEEIQ